MHDPSKTAARVHSHCMGPGCARFAENFSKVNSQKLGVQAPQNLEFE